MDLSNYVRVATYDLPEPTRTTAPAGNLLAQEASGVTYNWDTKTLFVIADNGTSITQVSLTGQFIDTMTLASGSSPQGTTFYDTEGITYLGGGQFAFTEERWRQVDKVTYAPGTTLTRSGAQTVDLGTDIGNVGLEGIAYDPLSGNFILVKEKDALGIFETSINFANGTASNGSASTVNSVNLFNPALVGTSDLSDVYAMSSNVLFRGTAQESHLLILSQESGRIVEIGRDGTVYGQLQLTAPTTPSGIDLAGMTVEGITMDDQGRIYLVSEQGGGDSNHPQLWVYAPASGPNQAPTGISLTNPTTSILENTSTATRIKVADLSIADDGQGVNTISLTGADAAAFEVDGTALYLKAGTVLDYEAKTAYAVTVNVDDTSLGATPDASTNYTLNVGNIVNEQPAGSVAITEVAPWSSGYSAVGADWFELTNTGSTAIDITGWKVDDNSYSFGSALTLNGVSSIAPGESVIFLEGGQAQVTAFINAWFGGVKPAGLHIGTYSGSGIGFGTGGDAVNVFDSAGALKASVTFGASTDNVTFDNAALVNSTSLVNHANISTLSANGLNGAFVVGSPAQTGSPGSIGGGAAPVNQAPTAINLTGEITSLADNISTATRVKVASFIVTDDGLGTNTFTVTGADASAFEADATGLYIKAGTTLDATVKSHYDVTVNVDDTTVGLTPDASASFALDLTHVTPNPLRITEVAAWSSGNSPVGADWFEVTNTSGSAVSVAGWKVDDSSNSFGNAVALNGVTSVAAGESVIFIETSNPATVQSFIDTWFGGVKPAGLQIGTYSGSGIGLSTGGDALNLYNASGALQANVTFGSSPEGPYATFDNAAGANNGAVSTLSAAGVNGAFVAARDPSEIGSPGLVAASANTAPTAVTLSNVLGKLHEDVGTATRIKVADVTVVDDGLGANVLSLSGADAALFQLDGGALYLKAGATLDYETKPSLAVTVSVNDATVGGTPDASTNYVLNVANVANEGAGAAVLRITEVAPWSSGNSPVGADWFEVTNTGTGTANITGWKVDDNSFAFANAVELKGVVSVGAGESVIFIEGTAATAQAFIATWFNGALPAGLQVGYYAGGGVSLSTGGDGLALYNGAGAIQAKVSFGSSPSGAPFGTFDNSAGADNVTIAAFSTVGVNGAFVAAGDPAEIGSPGVIKSANVGPVAVADTAAVDEDGTVTINVLANDTDADAGDTKTLLSVSSTAKGASVSIVDGKVVYVADADVFDALVGGQSTTDSFTYLMRDAAGVTSSATVNVTINGVADGATQTGGAGADPLNGTSLDEKLDGLGGNDTLDGGEGADTLAGGAGNDMLIGGGGRDSVTGGDGNDTIVGGAGDDVMIGARGTDLFSFGANFGHDIVSDFRAGEDKIQFLGVPGLSTYDEMLAHAVQSGTSVLITDAAGDVLQLNSMSLAAFRPADFLFA